MGDGSGADREGGSWEKASPGLGHSQSMGSLEFSHEQVTHGLQQDSYQQALQDNSKLARKVRSLQDQLAITSAKKDAFMAQAQRLEREFKKGREQSDTLQRELLEAKREANQLSKDASEAIGMMNEMRKAHIHEVRLLQRGLQARNQDASMRNRVNDVADLVDKVGRAVLQRDEALRDKTKTQVQMDKMAKDMRIIHEECGKLRRQNKQLQEKLKEARRKGKFVVKRSEMEPPEDSDEEFEGELAMFEKRFQIMEEGPAGLDILASNLSKEKQALEKRLKGQTETLKTANSTLESWKHAAAEKDEKNKELNERLTAMMKHQARLEEQIADKRREIEAAVAAERSRLEARIAELENDYDDARELADGMEKASSALTRELVKVHETYARPVPGAGGGPAGEDKADSSKGEQLASTSQKSKMGEQLKLEVYRKGKDTELRASEAPNGEECRVKLSEDILKELDEADPWTELFTRVGVDPGPPRRIVVASQIGQQEASLPPANTSLLLTIFRYSADRYLVSGMDLAAGTLVEVAVAENDMNAALKSKISACKDNSSLFKLLTKGLSFEAGSSRLSFSAASAARP
mmetsp:Transcript_27778/g.86450  ORF Transcript_27778/g.86450 Transcript_27778/m.86450 type:complete len:580 (+) Transcript_27778:3-1742(+)